MSHDPKFDAPEFVTFLMACDECNRDVDPNDAAPSCGVHLLHLGCVRHFRCRGCALVWDEAAS